MFKRLILLVVFCSTFLAYSFAQNNLETVLRYTDTTNFNFSGEWQYLSSDIYLFNPNKFSDLINELPINTETKKGKRKKKNAIQEEVLEYLFISAKLKDVKFFGNNEITYPLYNFQINKDPENKYQTFVSDNIDHVRIIDNLPLYTAGDYIDAEVKVRAISNSDGDQILSLIAKQLQSLSGITTPTHALMSLIGEFGKFMESNTQKKEYKFSSTIRLYEQKNFDTRLHSLKLYEIVSTNSKPDSLYLKNLGLFLDTCDNPVVSRDLLSQIINYNKYPYLIIANYKSLYKMEEVTGDEVTFANIEKRKLKIENDYRANLINTETYRQEKDFIQFITVFANLKTNLEMYKLNYKTGNSDAFSAGLFRVIQYYRQILKAFTEIEYKYEGKSTYNTVFKGEYESIIGFANLYLEEDHNLKLSKDLVYTILELEKKDLKILDSLAVENVLGRLHYADMFKSDFLKQSVEGQLILEKISALEQKQYNDYYIHEIDSLKEIEANEKNIAKRDELKMKIFGSECVLCHDSAFVALEEFDNRYQIYLRNNEIKKSDSLIVSIEEQLFDLLEKDEYINTNFEMYYTLDSLAPNVNLLYYKFKESNKNLGDLQDLLTRNIKNKSYEIIKEYNAKILSLTKSIQAGQNYISKRKPELAQKPIPKLEPELEKKKIELQKKNSELNGVISSYREKFSYLYTFYQQNGNDSIIKSRIQINLLQLDSLDNFSENESEENRSILTEDFTLEELINSFEEEYISIKKLIDQEKKTE